MAATMKDVKDYFKKCSNDRLDYIIMIAEQMILDRELKNDTIRIAQHATFKKTNKNKKATKPKQLNLF